jgi:hypothetical protein
MTEPLSRKQFLDTTARTIVAASVGALGGGLAASASGQTRQVPITAAGPTASPLEAFAWPWPYAKLDTEDVRKRAHKFYYDGGCCYGAFNGLVSALADTVGAPFTLVPPQMFYFGGGGGAGWGTLCGALNGAAALVGLVVDRTNTNAIVSELFGWYTRVPFPSDISNDYATKKMFLVNRNDKALLQTVSTSPLCHASVSAWCSESGTRSTAPERAERCARLTGDVAAKTVEALNQFVDGRFRGTFVPERAVTECMGCHDSTLQANVLSTTKMDCRQCHNKTWDHLY